MNKTNLTLVFLFIANFLLAFSYINAGLFHYDAVLLAEAVEKTVSTGELHGQTDGRYGSVIINSIIYLPFYLLGENADFTTRLSSVLFHALSISALFLFLFSLTKNYKISLFIALLQSVTPHFLSPNTYGKEHAMAAFFLFLSWYYLTQNKYWLSNILLFVSISVREAILMYIPLSLILYFRPGFDFVNRKFLFEKKSKKELVIFISVLLIIISLGFLLYQQIITDLFFKEKTNAYIAHFASGLKVFKAWSSAFGKITSEFSTIYLLLITMSILFYLWRIIKVKIIQTEQIFMLVLFAIMLFISTNITFEARYLDISFVSIHFFVAYFISSVFKKHNILAFAFVAYLVVSTFLIIEPVLSYRHESNELKNFALTINKTTEQDSAIITADEAVFLNYYAPRKILGYPRSKDSLEVERIANATILPELLNSTPIYLSGDAVFLDTVNLTTFNKLKEMFNVKEFTTIPLEQYHQGDIKRTFRLMKIYKVEMK